MAEHLACAAFGVIGQVGGQRNSGSAAYAFCRPGHPILGSRRVTLRDLLRFPSVHTRIPPRVAAAFPRPPGRTGRIDESTKDFLPAVEVDVPMRLAGFARDSDAPAFGVLGLAEQEALCIEREARLAKNFS